VHEGDEPDVLVDLLDADFLAGEDGGEVHLLALVADAPASGDGDGLVVERVFELAQTIVGSGRARIALGGAMHVEGLVWPRVVIDVDEMVEAGLLLQEIGACGFSGFLLEREMHALVAAILLRMNSRKLWQMR